MRLLYRDTATWSCDVSTFKFVGGRMDLMTYAANKRDIWMRMVAREAQSYFPVTYVTKTRSEAVAITGYLDGDEARVAAGVIAYGEEEDHIIGGVTILFTNQVGTDPDMTGLGMYAYGAGMDATTDCMYGYMASPSKQAIDYILALLKARMGSGQILDGYSTGTCMAGPENLLIHGGAKCIAITGDEEDIDTSVNLFGVVANLQIVIADSTSNEPETYLDLLERAANVRSLLADEDRTLGSLCRDLVVPNITGPQQIAGEEESYMAVTISARVMFPTLESDA